MTVAIPASWIPKGERIDHPERRRMRQSPARIKWCAGARRSGKTTDGLDYILLGHGPAMGDGLPMWRGAMCPPRHVQDPTYVIAAPTREMVKRIWWQRLKDRLSHEWVQDIHETELAVTLVNGSKIILLGMDRPTRGEGFPIDGLVGDEYAYWKAKAYDQSLRPAMSTKGRPPGWGILMGKPAGRNHFYDSHTKAKNGEFDDQDAFGWPSSVVIDAEEVEAARASLDERSFAQEYEGSFLTQTGLVFYGWDESRHIRKLTYDPTQPIICTFDFNVSPGAAVVMQEQVIDGEESTCCLWEFYKEDDSNSPLMCQGIRTRFADHEGPVLVYGDVGGHQRRTSAESTDWIVIEQELRKTFSDVRSRVARSAPGIIDSVNAVNARLVSCTGATRLYVDKRECPETVRDFEGVVWTDSGDRDIDKGDKKRTHWVDAIRYYVAEEHPLDEGGVEVY